MWTQALLCYLSCAGDQARSFGPTSLAQATYLLRCFLSSCSRDATLRLAPLLTSSPGTLRCHPFTLALLRLPCPSTRICRRCSSTFKLWPLNALMGDTACSPACSVCRFSSSLPSWQHEYASLSHIHGLGKAPVKPGGGIF